MIFGGIMRFQAHWRLEGVMARKTGRAALRISEEERGELERLAQSRTAPRREVERAGMNRYPFDGRQGARSVIQGRPVRSLATNQKPAGGG